MSNFNRNKSIKKFRPQVVIPLVLILLFTLTQLVFADPIPEATLGLPDAPFLGSEITFSVAFSNGSGTSTDVGYGPYIDLFLPKSGADGQAPTPAEDDGITFLKAEYLGVDLTTFTPVNTLDCPAGTIIAHPLTGEDLTCPAAPAGLAVPFVWELTVLELPFGSFVPDQPAAVIDVTAQLSKKADIDKALPILATPIFRYGKNPLDDPLTDPPIVGTTASGDITPTLITLTKAFSGPEQETATGPNYVRQHTITISIADDQPFTDFFVTDLLPPEMQYWEDGVGPHSTGSSISITTTTGVNCRAITEPTNDKPHNGPNDNKIVVKCDELTGTAGADLVIVYDFFIPEYLNDGVTPILDPINGGCVDVINDAAADGDWDPFDDRDDPANVESDETDEDDIFDACALVIQKGISNENPTVGEVLVYDYDIQVSDYFTLGGDVVSDTLQIEDTFSDGQLFLYDAYGAPNDATLSFTDRAGTSSGFFQDGVNLTVDTSQNPDYIINPGTCGDGSTFLDYDLSQQLIDINTNHPTAIVVGGCVVPGTGDPGDTLFPCNPNTIGLESSAEGAVEYKTQVQDVYACIAGDPSVDQNDKLSNVVDIEGDVLDNTAQSPTGGRTVEGSSAGASIITGTLNKFVYARNGVIGDVGPFASGDTITYRLTYDFPFSDFENFRLLDYLPLPVLQVNDFDGSNSVSDGAANWTFDPTVAGALDTPAPGFAQYGPDDSFNALTGGTPNPAPTPTLTVNTDSNSLLFFYGDYDNPNNPISKIDILFTLRVIDEPTADDLFFTNQARSIEENTIGDETIQDKIVFFKMSQPVLNISKGVVAVDNTVLNPLFEPTTVGPVSFNQGVCPSFSGKIDSDALANTPINSDLSGVDAADTVTMAIVVENTGGGRYGAFDVSVFDTLPAPLNANDDVSNICVQLGDGTQLLDPADYSGDLFAAPGIELVDPDDTLPIPLEGALARGKDSNGIINDVGDNILIITYDVLLPEEVAPAQVLTNEAEISNYANIGGGDNFIDTVGPQTDDADVTTLSPIVEKALISTELENSTNNRQQVVIGERVTYTVTLTIPEGTAFNAKITDTLDSGLAFAGCNSINTSSDLTSTTTFASNCTAPTVTPPGVGNVVEWDLGTLINGNTDNTVPETITINYDAVVLNVNGNQNILPTKLDNSAVFSWEDIENNSQQTVPASADEVTVIEPELEVLKSVTVDGSGTTGDAGDTVVYVIDIAHTGDSQTDAYDMDISDAIPAKISGATVTAVTDSAATLTTSDFTISSNILTNNAPIDMPIGRTIQITVTGTLGVLVNPGETLTNKADIEWTSLDGTPSDGRDTYNDNGVERTGDTADPGGAANNYNDTASAPLTIIQPTMTKVYSGSNQDHTSDSTTPPEVAIGEIISYTVTIQVPEGTSTGVSLVDTLDPGLAYVGCLEVKASAGLINTIDTGTFLPAEVCNDNVNPVVTSVGSAPTADGRKVTWTFGTVTNTDTNDATPETIEIVYQAVVLNWAENNRDDQRNNSAIYNYGDSNITKSAPNVIIVEPTLEVFKDATPDVGDAGDIITMTLTIEHTGASNADAFDVVLEDELSGTGFTHNGVINCNLGQVIPTTCAFSGTKLNVTWDEFPDEAPPYKTIIKFEVTIDNGVIPAQVLTNEAFLEWTGLPEDPNIPVSTYNDLSVERTGDTGDDGGEANTYRDDDDATVLIGGSVEKSIIATSEDLAASTSGDPVSALVGIGEIVRYRLQYWMPEGSSPDSLFLDRLPDGVTFLNDGTAKLAFIADGVGAGAGITSSLPSIGIFPQIVGPPIVAPTFVLPDEAISTSPTLNEDTYGPGVDVYFKFGDLENFDSDFNKEYVIIEFNVLVNNIGGNTAGTDRTNVFDVYINGNLTLTSNFETVRVVEPDVSITKDATTEPVDAGDPVVYQIVVTNASGDNVSDAFDLLISDTLDINLELVSVSVSGGVVFTDTSVIGGQAVKIEIEELLPGQGATITVNAQVIDTAAPHTVMPNTVELDYSSLPGPNGTTSNDTGSQTPGTPGSDTGERLYEGSANESVDLDGPQFRKLQPDPATFTIGELVTYTLVVSMTEGVTADTVVLDKLPPGLGYQSYKIITAASESGGLLAANYNGSFSNDPPTLDTSAGGDPNDVSWDFGSVTTTADNVTNNNAFLIEVVVVVLNDSTPLTENGDTLVNSAEMDYTGVPGGVPLDGGSATITIVEPQITTDKTVVPTTGVQAGDTLIYTVVMTNTGFSTAYNVTFTDTLAVGTGFDSLTECRDEFANLLPSQATDNGATVLFEGNPVGSWTVPVNGIIKCIYEVTVLDSVIVDGDHTNIANADWASLDNQGPVGEGRVYDDTNPNYTIDGDQDVDDAVFSMDGPTFAKTDGGTTNVAVGSTVPYTLTINSPLGTLKSLVISDTLPAGLSYNGDAVIGAGVAPTPAPSVSTPNDGTVAVDVVWTFGDAVVSSSPFIITFSATVEDTPATEIGGTVTNEADLSYVDADGDPHLLEDDDSVFIEVPGIDVEKTVYAGHNSGADCPANTNDLVQDVTGAPVTYCFVVTNTGNTYLDSITLTDGLLGIDDTSGMVYLSGPQPLPPNTSVKLIYYFETTLNDTLNNTVVVTGDVTDQEGTPSDLFPGDEDVTADDDADVEVFGDADYGDLPDSLGTTFANNGARHAVGNTVDGVPTDSGAIWLGPTIDSESDGQPTSLADGDNILNLNDEDGVTIPQYNTLIPNATIEITATLNTLGGTADLGLWIDWDGDGSFDNFYPINDATAGEQVFSITVPSDFATGNPVYYRVRAFPSDFNPTIDDATGFAINGEVEDYAIQPPPLAVSLTDVAGRSPRDLLPILLMVLVMAVTSFVYAFRRHRESHPRQVIGA